MTRRQFKPLLLATVAGLGLLAGSLSASAETLADALVSAYKVSHLLEQNRATLRAADEDVATAVSALRPVAKWGAEFSRSRCNMPSTFLTSCDGHWDELSATMALTLDWTLFDFGRNRLTVDIQKETVLATRAALLSTEQDVLLSAVKAYADAKATAEQVAITENSVRVISEQLKAAQDRFDVGEVTKTDVSQAEASLAGARASLAAAQGEYKAAREAYKAVIGHYPERLSRLPKAPKLPKTTAEANATALRLHPVIKQAQHLVSAADLGVELAFAQHLPTVTGEAQLADPKDTGRKSTLTLSIGQPIYSGGAIASANRKAVANRSEEHT